MEFKELEALMKRFLGLPGHWYGDLVLKFQAGEIVNVKATTSYDMNIIKNLKVEDNGNGKIRD